MKEEMKNIGVSIEISGLDFFRDFYITISSVDELDDIEETMKKALKDKGYNGDI